MTIAEGKKNHENRSSRSNKLPTNQNQKELRGLKEKIDHLIRDVREIMDRMKSHEQDG